MGSSGPGHCGRFAGKTENTKTDEIVVDAVVVVVVPAVVVRLLQREADDGDLVIQPGQIQRTSHCGRLAGKTEITQWVKLLLLLLSLLLLSLYGYYSVRQLVISWYIQAESSCPVTVADLRAKLKTQLLRPGHLSVRVGDSSGPGHCGRLAGKTENTIIAPGPLERTCWRQFGARSLWQTCGQN